MALCDTTPRALAAFQVNSSASRARKRPSQPWTVESRCLLTHRVSPFGSRSASGAEALLELAAELVLAGEGRTPGARRVGRRVP